MHVPVEVVLDFVLGHAQFLGDLVGRVQRLPVAAGRFAIGAVVVEHLQAAVREHALREQRRVRPHAHLVCLASGQAAQVADAHVLPQRRRVGKDRGLVFRHGQRAVGEPLGLLDLHEGDGFAQRLEDLQAHGGLAGEPVELDRLRKQLALRLDHVGQRDVLEPRLAGQHVGEFGCGFCRELRQFEGGIGHGEKGGCVSSAVRRAWPQSPRRSRRRPPAARRAGRGPMRGRGNGDRRRCAGSRASEGAAPGCRSSQD